MGGGDDADSGALEQLRAGGGDQELEIGFMFAASASSISARRAVARMVRTVARCSTEWLGRVRSRAQRFSCSSVVPRRSWSRSACGALTMSALSWPIALVRAVIAPSRVVRSTRMASRHRGPAVQRGARE